MYTGCGWKLYTSYLFLKNEALNKKKIILRFRLTFARRFNLSIDYYPVQFKISQVQVCFNVDLLEN